MQNEKSTEKALKLKIEKALKSTEFRKHFEKAN